MVLSALPLNLIALMLPALVAAGTGMFLWEQAKENEQLRVQTLSHLEQRATQVADGVSLQVEVLVNGIDYTLRALTAGYVADSEAAFERSVAAVMEAYPEGAILQVSAIDPAGYLQYSSLGIPPLPVYLGDREHFAAHLDAKSDRLFVGRPVVGRVSGKWSIQFSRPLHRGGRFAGALVVSVAPEYIARSVATLEMNRGDVLSILRPDGSYIARSYNLEGALGKAVPADRPYLVPAAAARGAARWNSTLEGLPRTYGWRQRDSIPLIVVASLAEAPLVAATEARIASDWRQTTGALVVVWILTSGVVLLLIRLARHQSMLERSEARFRDLATMSSDWFWEQDEQFRFTDFSPAFYEKAHVDRTALIGKTRWEVAGVDDVNEAEWAAHRALLARHEPFRGFTYRVRTGDGTVRWWSTSGMPVYEDGRFRGYRGTGQEITERKRAEEALRNREVELQCILGSTADGILAVDNDGKVIHTNRRFAELWRIPATLLEQRDDQALLEHVLSQFAEPQAFLERVAQLYSSDVEATDLLTFMDGRVFERYTSPLNLNDARVGRVWSFRDITERKRTEDLTMRFGRILDHSSNEIYVFDAESLRFSQVNQGALRNLGYTMDEMRALTPLDLKPTYTPEQFAQLIAPLNRGEREVISFETTHRRKDGTLYPVEVRLQHSATESPPVYVAIIQDITERRQTEERLSYLAFYDVLTNLPNRRLLLDRLRQTMADSERHHRLVAVMFLDLDHFKLINDNMGHGAGDVVLQSVGQRLSECVRPGDTVARFGGDEFAVVLADVAHVDDVGRVAQKILDAFKRPLAVDGREVFASVSIGITLYPFDDEDPEALLRNADTALYDAKDSGRSMFRFYTADLNTRTANRVSLEASLRHALERDEFVLHYQPQVDLASGRVIGAEALVRWLREDGKLVPPRDFIPLAESTGLIVPIGEWVLRTACAQNRFWQRAGLPPLQVAVNVAARQFQQQDLADVILRILHETDLDPRLLTLEITESTIMRDTGRAAAMLRRLAALGVRVAIDDFGTGYSSLSYLKHLPVTCLKIDRTFVGDVTTDPSDAAIVSAIIGMAHHLGLGVIAEGVETAAQSSFLRQRGCDVIQGFHLSKPLAPAAFAAFQAEFVHPPSTALRAVRGA